MYRHAGNKKTPAVYQCIQLNLSFVLKDIWLQIAFFWEIVKIFVFKLNGPDIKFKTSSWFTNSKSFTYEVFYAPDARSGWFFCQLTF